MVPAMSLPPTWKDMALEAFYATLNDPDRRPTPQSTVEAILYAVRERGIGALDEPDNVERMRRCDQAARRQINERIAALFATTRAHVQ
jgi:hypothetical protein